MVAERCQLGVLFGGQQFILFAIEDIRRGDNIVHQMQCSHILQTSRAPGSTSPDAIQVTIAALLGPKKGFFRANNISIGIAVGTEKSESKSHPQPKAVEQAKSAKQSQRRGKAGAGAATSSAGAVSAAISVRNPCDSYK